MTPKLINYLSGTVKVRVTGAMPERFINLCLAQHIFLWGISKHNNELYAFMRLPDFYNIRPIACKSRSRVRLVAYYGAPFLIKRIKRRKMLVAGAIIFLFLLNMLASYIWFVDITGVKTLPKERIAEVVLRHGLRPGAAKDKINIKSLEHAILLEVPELAWVGVSFTGTRAVVEVVEKTLPKQEDKAPANIVAAKDGVIEEIILLAGQAAVKKGDTVKKGDIVVKGVMPEVAVPSSPQPAQPPTLPPPTSFIKANAIVKARVWYESYGEASLVNETRQRTGNQYTEVVLKLGQHEVALKKGEPPYVLYETEEIHKKLPGWRNSEFAVESTIKIYHELQTSTTEILLEEARDNAKNMALHAVQRLIPESAHILSRNIEILKISEPNLVRVKVSVETIEDIGQSVPISQ